MKKRVHVVFTGGTIGALTAAGTTSLASAPPRQILSQTPDGFDVDFSESEPLRILSEDATPAHWTQLARHVAALDFANLDAVVIAHGSDTLAWTAKALAYALEGCPKPVVLVAANRPLDDPDSNGPSNFRDAVAFALSENLPGVFAAWCNPGEDTAIHLATRLLPCDIHDDRFRSARGLVFGWVERSGFRRNAVEGNPSRSHLAKTASEVIWARARRHTTQNKLFEDNILVLPALPSSCHPSLEGAVWKAVVQFAYHSGTACSDDAQGSFLAFARGCQACGIEVVVGPGRTSAHPYESVARLRNEGVFFAPALTESALVVKLMWLLAQGRSASALSEVVSFDLLPRD